MTHGSRERGRTLCGSPCSWLTCSPHRGPGCEHTWSSLAASKHRTVVPGAAPENTIARHRKEPVGPRGGWFDVILAADVAVGVSPLARPAACPGFLARGGGWMARRPVRCGGGMRAGQAAARGGPQVAANRVIHWCSRCQPAGRWREVPAAVAGGPGGDADEVAADGGAAGRRLAVASSTAGRCLWPDRAEAECVVAVPYLGIGESGGLQTAREPVRVDEHHGVAEMSQAEQDARGAV